MATRLCSLCFHVTWQTPHPSGLVLCTRCAKTSNQEN